MKNHTVQLAVMLVLGIAIGAIGAQLAGQGGTELRTPGSANEESLSVSGDTISAGVEDAGASAKNQQADLPGKDRVPMNTRPGLTVADQPAGTEVIASGLSVESPQWLAVYDDRSGKPGWILGAKRILPGDGSGTIALLRGTVSGETYYVVMHGDDGDLEFSKTKDPVPAPDTALMVTFTAQ